MNYTSQEIEKADNWLSDWIKSSIKTERQKREAILVIIYNPITNKTLFQRILLKKDKGQ